MKPVSRVAERWFVSITVDTQEDSHLPKAETKAWWVWIWAYRHWQRSQRGR